MAPAAHIEVGRVRQRDMLDGDFGVVEAEGLACTRAGSVCVFLFFFPACTARKNRSKDEHRQTGAGKNTHMDTWLAGLAEEGSVVTHITLLAGDGDAFVVLGASGSEHVQSSLGHPAQAQTQAIITSPCTSPCTQQCNDGLFLSTYIYIVISLYVPHISLYPSV